MQKRIDKPKQHGGKRQGAGAPLGNTNGLKDPSEKSLKRLVSARVTASTYEAIARRAGENGRTLSAEVALILEEVAK